MNIMKTGVSCGHLTGHIRETESRIAIKIIALDLDRETAYALCNLLCDSSLKGSKYLADEQIKKLSSLGAALGRVVEHSSAKNGTPDA